MRMADIMATQQGAWEDMLLREPEQRKTTEAAPPAPKPRPEDPEQKLASYMTHELRAPLTSIRSALGLLELAIAKMTPEERQTLHLAVRNAERLDGLINDIMDFSKIRSGKLPLEVLPQDPQELLAEACDSLRAWAVAKGVRLIRVESDEPLPRVAADRRRTVQVLINLLSNAIKFTPAGGKVEVSARLGRHDHTGTVEFRVKDSGPGIPHQDLERIFQCFEQSAQGAKMSSGTGLGLTLAKAMVELQSGRIWAESWKGLGAEFHFTIPVVQGDITRPVRVYPKPVEYHGILVGIYNRLNAFVTTFFA